MSDPRNHQFGQSGTPGLVSRALLLAAGIGCIALLLHSANLIHRLRADGCKSVALQCDTKRGPRGAASGDYKSYWTVAQDISKDGILGTSYYRRTPGYPLTLLATRHLTGMITPVRWLGPLCAGLAAAAIAWMASSLAGRRRTAWISGTLFCVWLSAYQYAAALSPDGIHAFLAVTALGVTSGWRSSQRASVAVLAGALWIAVQILRPTFFPLALISPILLWKRGGSRRYAGISLALWGSSLLVPGFIIGSNWVHHDVAIISRVGYDNLACTAGPRLSEQRGQGNYHQLKKECLRHFRSFPIKQRAKLQSDRALREFKQYPLETIVSYAGELRIQMIQPLRPSPYVKHYPSWVSVGSGWVVLFWFCAAGGCLVIARRDPLLALFFFLVYWLVMFPAMTVHNVGDRIRLPVDLMFIPVTAVFLDWLARLLRTRVGKVRGRRASD